VVRTGAFAEFTKNPSNIHLITGEALESIHLPWDKASLSTSTIRMFHGFLRELEKFFGGPFLSDPKKTLREIDAPFLDERGMAGPRCR
jgi:hypothetical protein